MLLHFLVVALVQGITEFIPVSSSAHLALIPLITDWPDQGRAMDVGAHIGTLAAILVYFRQDVVHLLSEVGQVFTLKTKPRLIGFLVVATLPALLAGFLLKESVETFSRSILVIGWMSLIFGGLMLWADRLCLAQKTLRDMSYLQAFLIGCAQAFAIVPGSSRSGTTITMARWLGFNRVEAFRFSFLLSIPVIAGAGLLTGLSAYKEGEALFTLQGFLVVFLSFLSGYLVLKLLMKWLNQITLAPFAFYRMALGLVLLAWGYHFF